MSRPLPRWYRHRCPHNNRVEVHAGGRITRDYCPDCGFHWPIAPTYRDQIIASRPSAYWPLDRGGRAR